MEVVTVKIIYLFSEKVKPVNAPVNRGIKDVPRMLEKVKEKGVLVEMINIDNLSSEEKLEKYLDAASASVIKKYKIRQIFGTRRQSAVFFGREVPALIVYDEKGNVTDVYPHEKIFGIKTIWDFLNEVIKTQQ